MSYMLYVVEQQLNPCMRACSADDGPAGHNALRLWHRALCRHQPTKPSHSGLILKSTIASNITNNASQKSVFVKENKLWLPV